MKLLASRRWRIFLTAWIVYSVHFATNVVREHYPAFSLVEHGTFRVDEYQGFHSDIFVHRDGHSYVANNVMVSVLAAVPLALFDPLLDALENYRLRQRATEGETPPGEYRIDKPNRVEFFRRVTERGLDLRFGAATVVTSAFFMAPLSALAVVLMFHVLTSRAVAPGDATWLALLFAFGTPVFFRTSHLNHNLFLMYAMFLAFVLLWRPSGTPPASTKQRLFAGFLAGFTLAADYMGAIVILLLYGYLLVSRLPAVGWRRSIVESLPFVAGSVPPVLFLLTSQWAMFGNPFLPAQYWMPEVHFTDRGFRGFDWPSPDLVYLSLFDLSYGLVPFGPLLAVGLVPVFRGARERRVLPPRERRFAAVCFVVLLLFCAANQYSRMQFNTGFRYLVPLVPFLFLAASDHLLRLPHRWRIAVTAGAVLHTWVLTVFREPMLKSWHLFLTEGPALTWLRVLRMTSPPDTPWLSGPLLPLMILGFTALVVAALWHWGGRLEAAAGRAPEPAAG